MRRIRIGALCAILLMIIASEALAARVMVVSDLHYLAEDLYRDSDLFIQVLRTGDGKYTQHSDTLMAALCAQAEAEKPDALIVTGDLSFNGEKESHIRLAEWFAQIESRGIPVWVIPGNHDINVYTPHGFTADSWYYTDAVSPEEFSRIYAGFMLPPEGRGNLSYTAEVDDRLWIAMTDAAYYKGTAQSVGLFTSGHASWLEKTLERAEAAGVQVITATHHNLLPHTQLSRDSFLMFGHEAMAELARRYGVRLNLSGHIHAQHIMTEDGLTDAATGAFCNWPHRYAMITLEDDGALTYEARSLDEALLPDGFAEDSRAWFLDISEEKTRTSLTGIDPAEKDVMAEYAARFNQAYFSGVYRSDDPAWKEDPAYALWAEHTEFPAWQYMGFLMNEPNGENLTLRLD